MSEWSGIPIPILKEHLYRLTDEEVVRHLFAVASGLDSLIMGEQQIQDQVRDAARIATRAGTVKHFLLELFLHAFHVGRKVRNASEIDLERPSVSSAAISLLERTTEGRPLRSILLVGAGKMVTLAANDLSRLKIPDIWVANRTIQRAEELAKRFGGKPVSLGQIPEVLPRVDAVLSCAAANEYIITEDTLKAKKADAPLVLVDAGVPRNIDPAIARMAGVQLYNIDDLAPFLNRIEDRYKTRIQKAEALVRAEAEKFYAHIRSYRAVDTLKQLREMAERIRDQELTRALRRMHSISERDREIVDLLTRRIINKLLHEPTARLKQHASNADGQVYEAAIRELFAMGREKDR